MKLLVNTNTIEQFELIKNLLSDTCFDTEVLLNYKSISSIIVNDLEELYFYIKNKLNLKLIINNTIPVWNSNTILSLKELGINDFSFIKSFELTNGEYKSISSNNSYLPIYGYIPIMKSNACIKKTVKSCDKNSEYFRIKDRKNVKFNVYADCDNCMNIISNSVPLSLHNYINKTDWKNENYYMFFTFEKEKEIQEVLNYYLKIFKNKKPNNCPIKQFTTAHFNNPVL